MKAEGTPAGRTIAERLAARAQEKAEGRAVALLAWSDMTGTERIALSIEKRLSGLLAALLGRWTVLGALGGEEIALGVMSLTLASRVDDDGHLHELAVELERGQGRSVGEPLWSVLRAPADPRGDEALAETLAVVDDWPDARQALIDWWGDA